MQLGLFSISYGGLWGQAALDLRAFTGRAADLGFEAVMLAGKRPHLSPLDMTEDAIGALEDELKTARVQCPIVAAYTDLTPHSAAEVPFLEMQIAYVESLCRIGQCLVRASFGFSRRIPPAMLFPTRPGSEWSRYSARCATRAQPLGMTIAVQNHHDVAVHTSALLELLHDVDRPNCKLGFDAWSPALRGENLYEAARQPLRRIPRSPPTPITCACHNTAIAPNS